MLGEADPQTQHDDRAEGEGSAPQDRADGEPDEPREEDDEQDEPREANGVHPDEREAGEEAQVVPPAILAPIVYDDVEEDVTEDREDRDQTGPKAGKESGVAYEFAHVVNPLRTFRLSVRCNIYLIPKFPAALPRGLRFGKFENLRFSNMLRA